MTRLLAELVENRIETRILEFMGNDRSTQPGITSGQTKPFKVAVVAGGNNARPSRTHRARKFIPANKIDQPPVILRGHARTPKQIDHGAGKLFIGTAGDSRAFR